MGPERKKYSDPINFNLPYLRTQSQGAHLQGLHVHIFPAYAATPVALINPNAINIVAMIFFINSLLSNQN